MKKVLIVEDDPISSKLFSGFLKGVYQSLVANTIGSAKKVIPEYAPDVIILDFALPDGTAIDILEFVKSIDMEVRCIVVTKFANTDIIRKCQAAGAFDFFQKPITKELLLEYLEIADYYTKTHSFSNTEMDNQESYKNLEGPFDLGALKTLLSADDEVIRDVLGACLPEFDSLSAGLRSSTDQSSPMKQKENYLYYLHRTESVARSIYADRLRKSVEDMQTALLRGETLVESDLELVFQEISRVSAAIGTYLSSQK